MSFVRHSTLFSELGHAFHEDILFGMGAGQSNPADLFPLQELLEMPLSPAVMAVHHRSTPLFIAGFANDVFQAFRLWVHIFSFTQNLNQFTNVVQGVTVGGAPRSSR